MARSRGGGPRTGWGPSSPRRPRTRMTRILTGGRERLRWTAKRLVFSVLRIRQPVYVFGGTHARSGRRLRALHVGNEFRGRYFIERFYGRYPEPRVSGRTVVGPSPRYVSMPHVECDLKLVEINRLYVRRYREAGYFAIPEWVEFGRKVVQNEDARYAGARKSLRTDLRAIRESSYRVVISNALKDLDLFYDRMYLPYISARFGEGTIAKSRASLRKDLQAGFLMLLRQNEDLVAGALVKVDGPNVHLTTLGVLDGSPDLLRSHVSGTIDYHLHVWAAEHRKRHINVGHTRPFFDDGVFFNKRKWQMSVMPDRDGVMNMALKWIGEESLLIDVLSDCPFVYQGEAGLGFLCAHVVGHKIDAHEARKILQRYWTEGLASLIAVCPGGVCEGVIEQIREYRGPNVHLCLDLKAAARIYREVA
jgi:hypothetical protein